MGKKTHRLNIPYADLRDLLSRELLRGEDKRTERLMNRLSHVRRDRLLSRKEFLDICKWKSNRPVGWYKQNSAQDIQKTITAVLCTRSEQARLDRLRSLKGVSIPVASAVLTMIDPRRYGVIDIRVWQILYALNSVRTRADGRNFTFKNWYQYLMKLRYFAKEFGVPARRVERSLFEYHKRVQRGRLYQS